MLKQFVTLPMPLKKILALLLFCISAQSFSQEVTLTPAAKISVLTCGSGQELYSSFGHSAIRVQDLSLGIDVVYNYGTFDFNTPNFYLKFVQGKLLYSLGRQRFTNFLYSYELERRWIKEQVLNIDDKEKNELFQFLEHNYLPENRKYQYDFFYDNCSSRIRDVLEKVFKDKLIFNETHLKNKYTFRELIHQNLEPNSWSSFGIDLALGSVIDKKASVREHMFLPYYLLKQFNNSVKDTDSLVERKRNILDFLPQKNETYFLTSPLFWLTLFMLFVITITYIDLKNNVRSRRLDFILFFFTGLSGVIVFLLWFATDHSATAKNFNVLWVFPFNLFVSFIMLRKKTLPHWIHKYVIGLLALLIFTIFLWLLKVQLFSPLIIPLLATLAIRYIFIIMQYKSQNKRITA